MKCQDCSCKKWYVKFHKGCFGKFKFPNKHNAEEKLRSIRKKKMVLNGNSYKCDICGFWHIGHYKEIKQTIQETVREGCIK